MNKNVVETSRQNSEEFSLNGENVIRLSRNREADRSQHFSRLLITTNSFSAAIARGHWNSRKKKRRAQEKNKKKGESEPSTGGGTHCQTCSIDR